MIEGRDIAHHQGEDLSSGLTVLFGVGRQETVLTEALQFGLLTFHFDTKC